MRLSLERKELPFCLAFYVGVPLLLSLPLGLFQAGYGKYFTPLFSFLFWVPLWIGIWFAAEVILQLLHKLLRPWNPPVLAEIVLSYALVVVLTAFLVPPYMEFFGRFSSEIPADFFARGTGLATPDYLWSLIRSGMPGLVAWTILRTVYAMLPAAVTAHSVPRVDSAPVKLAQFTEPEGRAGEGTPSPFRKALASEGLRDLGQIAALQASDHYVDVHLNNGGHLMILSRFSDAIEAMTDEDGLRVHRSFWVRRNAIAEIRRDGSAVVAYLQNGLECPVSTKYQGWFEHYVRAS